MTTENNEENIVRLKRERLIQDGGPQIYPPVALPPPEKLYAELKAMKRDDGPRAQSFGPHFSRLMNVYADHDERWKRLCIKLHGGNFRFADSWKRTCFKAKKGKPVYRLPVRYFYSPTLYKDWYRQHVSMKYFQSVPEDTVPRVHNPTVEEFERDFLIPNKPCVVTGALESWRARKNWTVEQLLERCGHVAFKCDEVGADGKKLRIRFSDYVAYMAENYDEDPIYVFDPDFLRRFPPLAEDYEVPPYFRDDYFACLGEEDRPDYRWIVIGPERSGSELRSPFHIDPYGTSAWNAVLQGRKRWLLYPPGEVPPGVDESEDSEDEVAYDADEPILYLVDHYQYAKRKPMECIMGPGDLIFVPSGWWHCVLNLDDTVAVTQNWAGRHNMKNVMKDLKLPSSSGTYKRFKKRFPRANPIEAAKWGIQDKRGKTEDAGKNGEKKKKEKKKHKRKHDGKEANN